jgi:hypothetical protein
MEGTLTGALKPGTIVQIDVSEGIDGNGNFSWEAFNQSADGVRPAGPIGILLPDSLSGQLSTAAYTSGDHCFVYVPVAGEEFNCIIGDVAGTGDDHAIGEVLIVDDGTGELIATTGSPEAEPFMLLETITDPTADTLAHVIYSGY